ncbi:MAG: hypothetical protein GVY16_08335 [Planctomycetes bacterium]|nr:hypothetical protein [Phycisphaerae bacterium]NBB95733.1 hypothetical protein [Planctomycetota bacterium]
MFFDDMTYKRVFFIKQQGLKHSVESQVGKWDGTNAAEIARQKFTDYPTGWELDTDGDEIGWHVLYNYQHTSVYPAEKDMANKMLEADRQKGGAK